MRFKFKNSGGSRCEQFQGDRHTFCFTGFLLKIILKKSGVLFYPLSTFTLTCTLKCVFMIQLKGLLICFPIWQNLFYFLFFKVLSTSNPETARKQTGMFRHDHSRVRGVRTSVTFILIHSENYNLLFSKGGQHNVEKRYVE